MVGAAAFCRPYGAPLAELVTSESVNQGDVKERGRSQVGAVDEVAVPEGGMEEIEVNFWEVNLGIGESEDISDCDGQAVKELIDDYVGSDVGRLGWNSATKN